MNQKIKLILIESEDTINIILIVKKIMKAIKNNKKKVYDFYLAFTFGGVLLGLTILPIDATVDTDFLNSYTYKVVFIIWFISTMLTIIVYLHKIYLKLCDDK